MQLQKVPIPLLSDIRDITLYTLAHTMGGPIMIDSRLRGPSLEGQRSIADFFHILDHLIKAENAVDYKLQKLDDERRPSAGPPVERSSPGNIVAGNYLIKSAAEGGEIWFRDIPTFFNSPFERTSSPSERAAKRARLDGGGSTASEESSRDPSDDSQGFKMRLIYRDKGCAVCLAAGIPGTYKYHSNSSHFEGSHIVPVAFRELWDGRGYSALVTDPFTDPANANDEFASPSTRTKKDLRRINSLENGILLCVQHRISFDNFCFAIHPDTHKIFSFHPNTANLQGLEVKAPWDCQDELFPPPHPAFLELHYFTSISRAMKGSEDDNELGDDDEDYEELSEPEEV